MSNSSSKCGTNFLGCHNLSLSLSLLDVFVKAQAKQGLISHMVLLDYSNIICNDSKKTLAASTLLF